MSLTLAGHEHWVNKAQRTRSALARYPVSSPVSVRVSRDVFELLAQVVGFRHSDRQVGISAPSWRVSNLQVLVARACMTDILARTEDQVSPQ